MKHLIMFIAIVLSASSVYAGQIKTDVCHSHGDGSYDLINVADPAVDSHIEHGDGLIGQSVPDMAGFIFDEACEAIPEPVADPFLRAIAWIDRVPDGRFNEGEDQLIARLRDEGNVATIEMGLTIECPGDENAPNTNYYVPFGTEFHTGGTITQLADGYRYTDGDNRFIWQANETLERYFERFTTNDPALNPLTQLIDYTMDGGQDRVENGSNSPSMPLGYVVDPEADTDGSCDSIGEGDDPFLQVSIFFPEG